MIEAYDRQGNRITLERLDELWREAEARGEEYHRVGDDMVGDVRVSTIFLIMRSRGGNVLSLQTDDEHLFETQLFRDGEPITEPVRWKTEDDAIRGHAVMLELAEKDHWVS